VQRDGGVSGCVLFIKGGLMNLRKGENIESKKGGWQGKSETEGVWSLKTNVVQRKGERTVKKIPWALTEHGFLLQIPKLLLRWEGGVRGAVKKELKEKDRRMRGQKKKERLRSAGRMCGHTGD